MTHTDAKRLCSIIWSIANLGRGFGVGDLPRQTLSKRLQGHKMRQDGVERCIGYRWTGVRRLNIGKIDESSSETANPGHYGTAPWQGLSKLVRNGTLRAKLNNVSD